MASQSTDAVLSPAKLAHFVLRTAQFKPMVAFYKTVLGAHAVHETEELAFLTYDDEHHRIAIVQVPNDRKPDRRATGLDHIAFTFNSLPDLLTAYKQRKAHGVVPEWSVNHGPTISFYYVDPDGNRIETQVDCFETPEEATAYMASPDIVRNPIGADIDPEDLLRRLESGEPESEIMKRADVGTRGLDSVPGMATSAAGERSLEPVRGSA
ncbi:Glyoxalase/Bleomycin resistance protein/Dihydroxybiphenyl dioxygenase [Thozetella sp. PMI_491]|nr:Glyoxalase/Bleomycin resistance protein/Dihydroxybiphenyl dioxygenase [Thozetella sp. PMI_491]